MAYLVEFLSSFCEPKNPPSKHMFSFLLTGYLSQSFLLIGSFALSLNVIYSDFGRFPGI
jgi:hypothetical protein